MHTIELAGHVELRQPAVMRKGEDRLVSKLERA